MGGWATDITLRWNNPLGLTGMDLTGGILNVTDRGTEYRSHGPGCCVRNAGFDQGPDILPERDDGVVRSRG